MRFGIVVNPLKAPARKALAKLVPWLARHDVEVVIEQSAARALGQKKGGRLILAGEPGLDLLVAMGGDGTILRAARLVGPHDVPILGINLGGLGFLTGFPSPEVIPAVQAFLAGEHGEERRMVLSAKVGPKRYFGLNDFVISMGPSCRVIELAVFVKKEYVCRFVGDGLVISTPTGSTAYSVAAGGPILLPAMRALLVTPICPHALSIRPLVLPAEEVVAVRLGTKSRRATLAIDGQKTQALHPGERLTFAAAPYTVRLVVPRDKSFYEILRAKMRWGGREDA